MKKIKLTQGKCTIVDDKDFEELNKYKWYCSRGYAVRTIWSSDPKKRKTIFMHRVILETPDRKSTDHANGDTMDNRRSNLRIVTQSENTMNAKIRSDNKSGIRGVCFYKTRKNWRARIFVDGKETHIGYFKSKKDAQEARIKAEEHYFGEYSYNNRKGLCL